MSLGARPLGRQDVEVICERKLADFRHKARHLVLCHLEPDPFFDAASDDDDVRLALETGFISEIESELRDPVLVRVDEQRVFTCPALALRVLADEPPEIHRAFVEGAFLRKFFRFFVPARFEGGDSWEAVGQVREIMQKHFAFQLIACETVLGQSA